MDEEPKHSITDVIRFLEDRQLEQDWDIRRDAIHYLREYEEKKDELDELIKEETLETHKAVLMTKMLTEIIEEKAKEDVTELSPVSKESIYDNSDETMKEEIRKAAAGIHKVYTKLLDAGFNSNTAINIMIAMISVTKI